jgi:hypothetical protein
MSEEPIINKVASSGIITLDLEEIYPAGERVVFDLKPLLWQEIALKEDDLRAFVKEHDWTQYKGMFVRCIALRMPSFPRGPTCSWPRTCSPLHVRDARRYRSIGARCLHTLRCRLWISSPTVVDALW